MMLLVASCSPKVSYKPLEEVDPSCVLWEVCTGVELNVYNLTGSTCFTSDALQAQNLMDILVQNNKELVFKCIKEKNGI